VIRRVKALALYPIAKGVDERQRRGHTHVRLDEQGFDIVPSLGCYLAHAQDVDYLAKDRLAGSNQRIAKSLKQGLPRNSPRVA
jgi:hypothetical protein